MHSARDRGDLDHVTGGAGARAERVPGRVTLTQRMAAGAPAAGSGSRAPVQRAVDVGSAGTAQLASDLAAAVGFFGGPAETIDASVAQLQAGPVIQRVDGGLPAGLRAGIETMAGMDMSGVRVHHDSSRPAELGALAYAQGDNIYLGPGQDRHLPHEAWHVVQQRQGRVNATRQFAGVAVNDDVALEREADVMGDRALAIGDTAQLKRTDAVPLAVGSAGAAVAQMVTVDFGSLPIREGGHVDAHCYWDYDSISGGNAHKLIDTGGKTYFPKNVVRNYGVMEFLWSLAQKANLAGTWVDEGMHGQDHDYHVNIHEGGINYHVIIHVGVAEIHLSGYPLRAGTPHHLRFTPAPPNQHLQGL